MDFWVELSVFVQIVLIDLSLAADNAIIVGLAAAGLPVTDRRKAIFIGIMAATVLRIIFSIFTVQLLQVIGLTLAGGLLLLWVCWKMFQHIRHTSKMKAASQAQAPDHDPLAPPAMPSAPASAAQQPKSLRSAILHIVIADVSMSLDNVLSVAGAARENLTMLVAGLALSVLLMGTAATAVVKLLNRYHWISYAGLLVVLYVAIRMIVDGSRELEPYLVSMTT